MNFSFLRLGVAGAVAFLTAGCTDMLYSDSENANRQSAEARQAAQSSMELASSQADAARPMAGQALVQLLSGNTHVEPYRKRIDDIKPYFTNYSYYNPDGTFIGRDTHSRRTVEYQGDPYHGLLTRIVKVIRLGLAEPEYISDPAAFR